MIFRTLHLFLSLFSILFIACNISDPPREYLRSPNIDPYIVKVDISQPMFNEQFRVGQPLAVKVVFSRDAPNKIVHNYKVEVLDAERNLVMTIDEKSPNEQGFVIVDEREAYVPTSAGVYIIRGISTDGHDENPNTGEQRFIVAQ